MRAIEIESPSDEALFGRMQRGDEEAFAVLYRRRQGPVYRFALQMCGSREVAEEVTQEVFLQLIRGAGQFDPARGALASWLYGVARNQVFSHLERDRRNESLDGEGDSPAAEPSVPETALDDLTRDEMREAVRQAVLALPPRYREVVVLCDLQELSYEQAAQVLETAIGTVRSRLHRGRALLADKLRAECGVER